MREPYQVLVILYNNDEKFTTYSFHRKKQDYWQFISGGKETFDKDLIDTVIREVREETGLVISGKEIIPLETVTSIPAYWFKDLEKDVLLVTEYSFAVHINPCSEIVLSDEHDSFIATSYENTVELLRWDSNKTALYELHNKLKRGVM